jgi:hypothetical protein
MKVLIDECSPRALKLYLAWHGHKCSNVQEAGWSGKVNGELLALAETTFHVLVTIATNLQSPQNLSGRKMAIEILLARSKRLEHLCPNFAAGVEAISRIKPGNVIQVGSPS